MWIVRFVWQVLVAVIAGCIWLVRFLVRAVLVVVDACAALRSVRGGELRCVRGHVIQTEGATWECSRCGFRWEGSAWMCANPECGATTPYLNCADCGLSRRSPFRWGRP